MRRTDRSLISGGYGFRPLALFDSFGSTMGSSSQASGVSKIPGAVHLVHPPRLPRKEAQALTPAQASAVLAAAVGDPLEALFVLAIKTGLRRGELLGLRWRDVDLEKGI